MADSIPSIGSRGRGRGRGGGGGGRGGGAVAFQHASAGPPAPRPPRPSETVAGTGLPPILAHSSIGSSVTAAARPAPRGGRPLGSARPARSSVSFHPAFVSHSERVDGASSDDAPSVSAPAPSTASARPSRGGGSARGRSAVASTVSASGAEGSHAAPRPPRLPSGMAFSASSSRSPATPTAHIEGSLHGRAKSAKGFPLEMTRVLKPRHASAGSGVTIKNAHLTTKGVNLEYEWKQGGTVSPGGEVFVAPILSVLCVTYPVSADAPPPESYQVFTRSVKRVRADVEEGTLYFRISSPGVETGCNLTLYFSGQDVFEPCDLCTLNRTFQSSIIHTAGKLPWIASTPGSSTGAGTSSASARSDVVGSEASHAGAGVGAGAIPAATSSTAPSLRRSTRPRGVISRS